MRVLMIVQELNEKSWLRGFTVGWVRALAAHVDEVHVLALELRDATLPDNVFVRSMGKEKGYTRAKELREFYRGLHSMIGRVDVIFSHMTPRYTWLAAPYAALYRKQQMLWFIHPRVNLEIRAAAALARWITTATENSFPLQNRKVHALGHGIDTNVFAPRNEFHQTGEPLVLAVGRISPIKQHHVLLETAALLRDQGEAINFAIAGQIAAPGDEDYRNLLLKRRDELGLSESRFKLVGALQPLELAALMRRSAIVTNITPAGSFDKAALEGMLTGTPLLTSNPAFDSLLGEHRHLLHIHETQPGGIAAKIREVLSLSPEQRRKIGLDLRANTAAQHGLDGLMRRIVTLMSEG